MKKRFLESSMIGKVQARLGEQMIPQGFQGIQGI